MEVAVNPKIRPGDTVLGFFLDGDGGQIPVIMGCFGRTGEVPSTEYLAPLSPLLDIPIELKNQMELLLHQKHLKIVHTQKSPRRVPPETSAKLNEDSEAEEGKRMKYLIVLL